MAGTSVAKRASVAQDQVSLATCQVSGRANDWSPSREATAIAPVYIPPVTGPRSEHMLIRAPHLLLPTSARTTGARPADCRPRMRCHIYIGAEGCGKASIRGRLAGWWAWLAQSGSTWSHARKLVGHHTAASTRCKFWIRNAQNQHHIGDVQLGVGCPSIRVIANDWQCDIPDRLEGAGLNCQILRSIGRGRLIYGSRSGASCITTQAFAAAANSATPRVAHCRVSHLRIVRRFARSRKSGASVAAFAISGPPAAQL